jgi:hypothetical protein
MKYSLLCEHDSSKLPKLYPIVDHDFETYNITVSIPVDRSISVYSFQHLLSSVKCHDSHAYVQANQDRLFFSLAQHMGPSISNTRTFSSGSCFCPHISRLLTVCSPIWLMHNGTISYPHQFSDLKRRDVCQGKRLFMLCRGAEI